MASVIINIPDGSPELEELDFVVAQIVASSDPTMTREKWLRDMVKGYIENRVRNVYKGYVSGLTTMELETKLGGLSSVR